MYELNTGELINSLICDMMDYESGVPHRIQHFIKVHALSKLIGELEGLDTETQMILEVSAVVHDIGIRPSLQKYNSSAGIYQEKEAPKPARKLIKNYPLSESQIDRICYIVGRHHTYSNIDGLDYQILIEADFLVNIFEEHIGSEETIRSIREDVFKTKTGLMFFDRMYPIAF